MPLALASEGQGARDMGFDEFFLSAEFVRRKIGGHGSCRAEICGRAGARPSKKIRRLKSALRFFVTDYGLKSVAWFVFDGVINYGLKPAA
jgi:hypothetical protein